jgi:hypothetical protein
LVRRHSRRVGGEVQRPQADGQGAANALVTCCGRVSHADRLQPVFLQSCYIRRNKPAPVTFYRCRSQRSATGTIQVTHA